MVSHWSKMKDSQQRYDLTDEDMTLQMLRPGELSATICAENHLPYKPRY